jgi:hypothetical protein
MKRLLVVVGVVFLLGAPIAVAAVPDVYESSAISGGLHASVSVPAFFEVFGPYAFTEASNGASHSYEAPGYGGFFLTAAAEQFGFPPPPGTTETLYPQGPQEASTPALPNGSSLLSSSGRSSRDGAEGQATVGAGGQAPYFLVGGGHASSSVKALASAVTATSNLRLQDLSLADGLVTIDQVVGSASARSTGRAGGGTSDGQISMFGVKVAGVSVDLRPDGVVLAGAPFTAPGTGLPVDDFLAIFGITFERLPLTKTITPDGRTAEVKVGGVRFTFSQPTSEFELVVTIGDLTARSRAVDLPAPPVDVPRTVTTAIDTTRGAIVSASGDALAPEQVTDVPQAIASRSIVRTRPVRGADWVAIAALAALAAPLMLIIRRAFRAAVRP